MCLNAPSGKLLTSRSRLESINWKLSMKTRCCPNVKAMVFLHIVRDHVNSLFEFTDLLHNEVAIISFQVVEYDWDLVCLSKA